MVDSWIQWATLASPIISVVAIIVALCVARSSSIDAQQQISAIRNILDVFVAANNLDIVEAQRKYQRQLADLNSQIEDAQLDVDTVYPFVGGSLIHKIEAAQKKQGQIDRLNSLLEKRKELEVNLSLIDDYIKKATKK